MWSRRTAGNVSFQKTSELYTTCASAHSSGASRQCRGPRAMPDTNRESLLDMFRRSGALLDGHFRLSSGLHSNGYLQCALVLEDPQTAGALGALLAERVRHLSPVTVLSPRETIEVARAAGAEVIGAAALVDRSGGSASLDVPFAALLAVDLPTWDPASCPLCAQGLPIVKPGSRTPSVS